MICIILLKKKKKDDLYIIQLTYFISVFSLVKSSFIDVFVSSANIIII